MRRNYQQVLDRQKSEKKLEEVLLGQRGGRGLNDNVIYLEVGKSCGDGDFVLTTNNASRTFSHLSKLIAVRVGSCRQYLLLMLDDVRTEL